MVKTIDNMTQGSRNDLVGQPVSALLWWWLPAGLAVLAEATRLSLHELAAVWSAAFVWMAVGCFLNAYRCHRLHCYISGPAFLAGAIAAGLLASGALANGPNTLNFIAAGTFAMVCVSFLPEFVWRKYV